MKTTQKGWVIINKNHPNSFNEELIFSEYFRLTRQQCISSFIEGSGENWKYWYRKYNFRCVKAKMTIITDE